LRIEFQWGGIFGVVRQPGPGETWHDPSLFELHSVNSITRKWVWRDDENGKDEKSRFFLLCIILLYLCTQKPVARDVVIHQGS